MIFEVVENGELISYRRIGSCNMCGECCRAELIRGQFASALVRGDEVRNVDADSDDWSEWEGWSTHRRYGLWWWWRCATENREVTCEAFVDGKCESWNSDEFPAICRDWPVHPSNLEHFPDCGFEFEREE